MTNHYDPVVKFAYILGFIILGLLCGLLIHGLLELFVLYSLLTEFSLIDLGISWDDWLNINLFGEVVLGTTGAVLGFWQGWKWWKRTYEI